MDREIRVRFAPSPTGWLHIGNARTALYNWLYARHGNGRLVLRIEDTDVERSTAQSESGILDALRWLGLDWDEGVEAGGGYGPYRQTERLEIYREQARKLVESGHAYHCFCTEELLEQDRQAALEEGRRPHYVGRCREFSPGETARRREAGEPSAIRFRVPREELVVDDLIRGSVTFPPGEFGDFVIIRSNGMPAYNFAVVVDDQGMRIDLVIRGEDHLTNTPKQIFLYRAMGFPVPRFAHLSMILGPDQTRLSKRHGATSVSQLRDMGYLPQALLNYLALLGWSPGDDREVMSAAEMIQAFSLDRVSKSASIFDAAKLSWMNGVYIRSMGIEDLYRHAEPFIAAAGLTTPETPCGERLLACLDLVRSKAHLLTDLPVLMRPYLSPEASYAGEALELFGQEGAAELLAALALEIEKNAPGAPGEFSLLLKRVGTSLGLGGKRLFMPVRAALTGETHGPELDRVYLVLGSETTVSRLRAAAHAASGEGLAP